MGKIICIGTLKGGCAKTMSVFQLSAILAEQGYKVLNIDLDPQSNLTTNFGIDITNLHMKGSREIFDSNNIYSFNEIVIKSPIKELPTLDIIPGSMLLHEAEFALPFASGRESKLKFFMDDNEKYFNQYDYILIDCNPSFSYLNQNAFVASDEIILLLTPDMTSINGVRLFRAIWNNIRKSLRIREDNVAAGIITMLDSRTNISKDFIEFVYNNPSASDISRILLNTTIPMNVKLKESAVNCTPINLYDRNCKGYEAYVSVVDELKRKGIL